MDKKRLKLLVIHQQESCLAGIKEYIEMNDHLYEIETEYTKNEEEAYRLFFFWRPSVVLLDAHIADGNCFAILDNLKDGFTPVIMTSKEQSLEIEKSAMDNGACFYHPIGDDPDSFEILLDRIAHIGNRIEPEH